LFIAEYKVVLPTERVHFELKSADNENLEEC